MTRSVPRICDALLRARPCLFRAPRALRLRPSQKQDRPARRQGPAGASDPGHDCMPACGRGAHCLLAQLAGRSPVMRHRGVMRTARVLRAGVAGGAPRKRRGGRRARLGTVPPAATRPLRGPGPPLHYGPCRTGWHTRHGRDADAAVRPAPSWSLSPPTPPLPGGRCGE